MRVVVDTNVLVSGTFFAGKPGAVIDAIADGRVQTSASSAILEEYNETIMEVARSEVAGCGQRGYNFVVRKSGVAWTI